MRRRYRPWSDSYNAGSDFDVPVPSRSTAGIADELVHGLHEHFGRCKYYQQRHRSALTRGKTVPNCPVSVAMRHLRKFLRRSSQPPRTTEDTGRDQSLTAPRFPATRLTRSRPSDEQSSIPCATSSKAVVSLVRAQFEHAGTGPRGASRPERSKSGVLPAEGREAGQHASLAEVRLNRVPSRHRLSGSSFGPAPRARFARQPVSSSSAAPRTT